MNMIFDYLNEVFFDEGSDFSCQKLHLFVCESAQFVDMRLKLATHPVGDRLPATGCVQKIDCLCEKSVICPPIAFFAAKA